MKGGGEDVLLADQGGGVVAFGEDFDTGPGFYDAGSADVDHFERAAFQLGFGGDDGAVDLSSVGVALDGGVEDGEAFLRGIQDLLRQQDAAGAGAEGGLPVDELLQRAEKAIAGQELEEGSRFAAGNDEAVDVGQLFRLADEDGFSSGAAQGGSVGIEIALNGEDADFRLLRAGQVPLPPVLYGDRLFSAAYSAGLYGDRLFSILSLFRLSD